MHWADSEDPRWASTGGPDLDRFLAATDSAYAVWVEEVRPNLDDKCKTLVLGIFSRLNFSRESGVPFKVTVRLGVLAD